jgi:hypothetical protein
VSANVFSKFLIKVVDTVGLSFYNEILECYSNIFLEVMVPDFRRNQRFAEVMRRPKSAIVFGPLVVSNSMQILDVANLGSFEERLRISMGFRMPSNNCDEFRGDSVPVEPVQR